MTFKLHYCLWFLLKPQTVKLTSCLTRMLALLTNVQYICIYLAHLDNTSLCIDYPVERYSFWFHVAKFKGSLMRIESMKPRSGPYMLTIL